MSKGRKISLIIIAAVIAITALGRVSHTRADDDDEEKPITSSLARVSRDAEGHVFVEIAPAALKEIGIAVETLKPVTRRLDVNAYGFVLDPAPLLKLNSDLAGAQAALDAADAQYRRTKRLYAERYNASLRDLQSAQAAYLADEAQVEALEQQLSDQWGAKIAQMDSRARSALLSALVARTEAIARVTAPVGEPLADPPHAATIFVLGHEEQPLSASEVYAAPAVAPLMQGQTFLLLAATRRFPAPPGTAVSARLPASTEAERGVMAPRSAVVRYDRGEWVYRALGGGRFARREIVPAEITGKGYFVTDGLPPGSRVVVTGAQALLSEELKAQIQMGD